MFQVANEFNYDYRLRFYLNSLIHIFPLSNSHTDEASIQTNRGVIVALRRGTRAHKPPAGLNDFPLTRQIMMNERHVNFCMGGTFHLRLN